VGGKTGSHTHVFGSKTTHKFVLTVQVDREQPIHDRSLKNTSEVQWLFKEEW